MSMTDWVAIAISLLAFGVSIFSLVYSRRQAQTAERTRVSEHDPSWRLGWDAMRVVDSDLGVNGEYDMEWILRAENIGRGTAFDFSAQVDEHTLPHASDVGPGARIWLADAQAEHVVFRWMTRDRKKGTWRGVVPPAPELPPGVDENDLVL